MSKVGQKVKFDREVQRYTIHACDNRYAIMTKPFNVQKTYLYTVTDLERKVRGSVNLLFGINEDINNEQGANNLLKQLQNKEVQVSYRNCVNLSEKEFEQLI